MIVWQLISFQSIYHAILNAVIFQYMRKLVRTFEILRLNDFFEIKLLVMGIGNWNLMFFASCSYCIAKTHRLHFWSHTPFWKYIFKFWNTKNFWNILIIYETSGRTNFLLVSTRIFGAFKTIHEGSAKYYFPPFICSK